MPTKTKANTVHAQIVKQYAGKHFLNYKQLAWNLRLNRLDMNEPAQEKHENFELSSQQLPAIFYYNDGSLLIITEHNCFVATKQKMD